MTPLTDAIDMAVRGEFPPGASEIDGHSFYIRSVKNKNRLKGDETSYFRHEPPRQRRSRLLCDQTRTKKG
jgi:hypothetical protein